MNNSLERTITLSSVLRFTMPSMIMMVVMSLYTIVDGLFVSRLVGTDAFSAVNIVYPLMSLTIGLGTMFGAGTTAIVSIKAGEGKREEANRNLTFIILVTVAVGVLITAVSFLFLREILFALGANEAIYGYCYDYAMPLVFFFTANILQLQFQSLYVADGKPNAGLVTTIIGGLANVLLDYVFIAVFGMGVTGAAVATGIGYSIPALYGLCHFAFGRRGNFRFVKPAVDLRVLCHSMSNGSSEMVSYLSTSVTTFLFNVIMMRLVGQDGVAAIAILLYLDFVLAAVSLGYSMGVAPLISYNYGCGRPDRLRRIFKLSVGFCAVIGLCMAGGTVFFKDQLASIFTGRGTDVYELAAAGLGIYAMSYLFKGYNVFSSAMFTAFGDGRVSALLSLMRTFVFLAASLVGLSAAWGVDGVWYATPLAELMALILSACCALKYSGKYRFLNRAAQS